MDLGGDLPVTEDEVVLPADEQHGPGERRGREAEDRGGGQELGPGEGALVRFGVLRGGEVVVGGFEEAGRRWRC